MVDLPWSRSIRIHSVNPSDSEAFQLLGRHPQPVDVEPCRLAVEGQTTLVTGAGGFIGSEICRVLQRLGAGRIVALDQNEQALAALSETIGEPRLVIELADMRDRHRFQRILERFRPVDVYHAAAYKNVPFLERFLFEAVANNTLATWDLAQDAGQAGVRRFIFVSSDKAASARNVVGITKRMSETLLAGVGHPNARFASVRCANVLGSPGSVLPRFLQQISAGNPLEITSTTASRYFLTAAEAAHAIVTAAHLAEGHDVFFPDPGQPVRIVDLATRLIASLREASRSGVALSYTGLRPGDQESELLIGDDEIVGPTACSQIRAIRIAPSLCSPAVALVPFLRAACAERNRETLLDICQQMIGTTSAPLSLP